MFCRKANALSVGVDAAACVRECRAAAVGLKAMSRSPSSQPSSLMEPQLYCVSEVPAMTRMGLGFRVPSCRGFHPCKWRRLWTFAFLLVSQEFEHSQGMAPLRPQPL